MKGIASKNRPLFIVGNWKMNPRTVKMAEKLFIDIREGVSRKQLHSKIVIAPPYPFLAPLTELPSGGRIEYGVQNIHYEKTGAFTGEVSLPMVQSLNAKYVIVGHSERRAAGESDEDISKKVAAVTAGRIFAILCIGEEKRDKVGNYFGVVEEQIKVALQDCKAEDLNRLIVAYEPVWAIGSGQTPTAADIEEMRLFIQKVLTDKFGRKAADKVLVLYGGSVNGRNTTDFLDGSSVNGFLVGGASLRARDFLAIIEAAENYAKS